MKIVFIVNSISAQRCIKRIEEFIANGYEVDVYGFSRKMDIHIKYENFIINQIGSFNNNTSIINRMPILMKGIKGVLQKYKKNKDVIFYLFQLDVALVFRLLCYNKRYFYEESDLMHTYINNSIIKLSLEYIDRKIINKSLISIFTSEGFLNYHFGEKWPHNIYILPNKLNLKIEKIEPVSKQTIKYDNLKIGFVGFPRYKSVINFIKVYCSNFPNYEFHVFGEIEEKYKEDFDFLCQYKNCFFHGGFINPDDLPNIYSKIDLVLSTYDVEFENVRYAEPNKIYEAIYFNTPIIVSKGTFLESKVNKLGIGFSVNAYNDSEIISFINEINSSKIEPAIKACQKIDKNECLNINTNFFYKISHLNL